MIRSAFVFLLSIVSVISALGQQGGGVPAGFDLSNYGVFIEPDRRVMTVLAALEVARSTNETGNPEPILKTTLSREGEKFREQLRSDLAAMPEDLRSRISNFVSSHKRRNPRLKNEEIIGQFVSMAYALGPLPELADPVVTSDLPGNVLDVLDFAPLVREFYRRSSFSGNLAEYIKTYQKTADGELRASAREMTSNILGYLHTKPQLVIVERTKTQTTKSGSKKQSISNIEVRERQRRFVIVPEMLAPQNYIHFVNIKDDYFVVLPPDKDVTFSEVRRAYLQFVADPIVLSNARDIATISTGLRNLLNEVRKSQPNLAPDVYLAVSRSLVAAVDAKQIENAKVTIATEQARAKLARAGGVDPSKSIYNELEEFKSQAAEETILRLSEDYEKGAVLAFYFADQLKGVEESGTDIAASMREMILSLDPVKEIGRYASYADVRNRAAARRREQKSTGVLLTAAAENPVTSRLIEIQQTIDAKKYAQAITDLKELAAKHPNEPRVRYNLGRVTSLSAEGISDTEQQNDRLREAKIEFEAVIKIYEKQRQDAAAGKRVEQPVDAALVSHSYVALAKIYEFYDQKDYAVRIYDAAIQLGDVRGGAFSQAIAGKQQLLKNH